MKPFQRELFAAQKQNNYLKKILKIKKEANRRIEKLEGIVTELVDANILEMLLLERVQKICFIFHMVIIYIVEK